MTNTEAPVTKAQAQRVLDAVEYRYRGLFTGDNPFDRPKLIQDFDESTPWMVMWEEGPYEWAMNISDGGTDDEMFEQLLEFTTRDAASQLATVEPISFPDDVWCEPYYSFALGIYPV